MQRAIEIISDPVVAGLAAGALVYLWSDRMRPSVMYEENKTTLRNELFNPMTAGGVVGLLVTWVMQTHPSLLGLGGGGGAVGGGGLMPASEFDS